MHTMPVKKKEPVDTEYKEVIIIGNGPSAISLSYILAGNSPYYKGGSNDDFLHCRLSQSEGISIVEQDLEFLADGLEGRSNNPVSVLFDALSHPEADLGVEKPSLLEWKPRTDLKIDHAVLGRGGPGGAWQWMEGKMLTVSLGSWMELPNFKMSEWADIDEGARVSVSTVANYYRDYVKKVKLESYFRPRTIVTSVKKAREPCYLIKCNETDNDEFQNLDSDEGIEENEVFRRDYAFRATSNENFEIDSSRMVLPSLVDQEMDLFSSSSCSNRSSEVELLLPEISRSLRQHWYPFDEWSARDGELDCVMTEACSWDPIFNPSLFGSLAIGSSSTTAPCISSCNRLSREGGRCCFSNKDQKLWEVSGYVEEGENEIKEFKYLTRNVVLATGGYDRPNTLNIPGESLNFVAHTLNELEDKIEEGIGKPLMIVGAGLSAADAIIAALEKEIPVVHVFRRETGDPNLIFNKLPNALYPEYHRVHRLMMKTDNNNLYTAIQNATPIEIKTDSHCRKIVKLSNGESVEVSYVALLIGASPNLKFFENGYLDLGIVPNHPISRNNPVDIDVFTHESISHPGLYAMGPLVGDNFVRFLQGGALAITSHLLKKKAEGKEDI